MKGEVTLKKNGKTKFTVYLNSEKIGELNQVEEAVGREDTVVYLWLWDPEPHDDRFRNQQLEDGGYYNPNKLFSEIEELVARTPEKKGKKAMMRRRRGIAEGLRFEKLEPETIQVWHGSEDIGYFHKKDGRWYWEPMVGYEILKSKSLEDFGHSDIEKASKELARLVGKKLRSKEAKIRRRKRLAQKTPVATIDIVQHEDYYTVRLVSLDGKPYRGEYSDMIPTKVEASNAAEALTKMARHWNLSGFLE